jgi:MFS family permease
MLLVGRALQGLGFAGLQTVTKVILSDKVSLKGISLNNTLFAFLNGASFSVGPVIGGYLTRVRFLPIDCVDKPNCRSQIGVGVSSSTCPSPSSVTLQSSSSSVRS